MNSHLRIASSACHRVLYDPTFFALADLLDDASLAKLASTCKNLFQILLSDPFWKGRLIRTEVPELVQLAKGSPLCDRTVFSFALPFLDDKALAQVICSSPVLGSLLWKIDLVKKRFPLLEEPKFERRREFFRAYAQYHDPVEQDRRVYERSAASASNIVYLVETRGFGRAFFGTRTVDVIGVGTFLVCLFATITLESSPISHTSCSFPLSQSVEAGVRGIFRGGLFASSIFLLISSSTGIVAEFAQSTGIERPVAGAVGVAARRGKVLLSKCTSRCEGALQPVARHIAPCWQRAQGHLSACWNWLMGWF